MRLTRFVSLVSGGPANLLLKTSELRFDKYEVLLTSADDPMLLDKVLPD